MLQGVARRCKVFRGVAKLGGTVRCWCYDVLQDNMGCCNVVRGIVACFKVLQSTDGVARCCKIIFMRCCKVF